MKKRWSGIAAVGLLLFTAAGMAVLPALAQEEAAEVRSVNLNIDGRIAGISDPVSADSSFDYWSGDYVHFGSYQGYSIRWRVLDANTAGIFNEKETMLLLSDAALETMPFRKYYQAEDAGEWRASDIRTWLGEVMLPGFEEGEQAAVAVSTKEVLAEDETQPEDRVFAPLENDRLFLLDAAEVKPAYGYGTSRARGNGGTWWTRSAIGSMHNHQGVFCRIGNAVARGGYESHGVVPACNLDISRIAFVSKGLVRKSAGFTQTEDGEGIGMWNLTLTDGSGFAARRKAGDGEANQVTVDVTALASGNCLPYTQISAMLADEQGTVLAYGKISDELRMGEITFSVPEGIPEGDYTLWVFEESVRENAELMQTDYASNMAKIPLKIGEPGETPETGEPETEEPETRETETEETEIKEPETEEPETRETETEEPETEETEIKAPETGNPKPEEGEQTGGVLKPQINPDAKRPSRPKITKIVRRGRTVRVRWKKLPKKVSGCQIQYSTSKKFKNRKVRNVYVKNRKTVQKKITGLKKGKRYYVRMRAFRKEGGRKQYSLWSRKIRI